MRGLVKNELIKLTKQTAYRIVTVVLLVLIVLGTLLNCLLPSLFSVDFLDPESDLEFYLSQVEYYEVDSAERLYYLDLCEAVRFFADENGEFDWKYDFYYIQYEELYLKTRAYQYMASGVLTEKEILNSSYEYYLYDGDGGDTLDGLLLELQALQNQIKNISFNHYINNERNAVIEKHDAAQAELAAAEALLKGDPDNNDHIYRVDSAKARVFAAERLIAAYDLIIDRVETPYDWRYKTVSMMKSTFDVYEGAVIMPEAVFDESYEKDFYSSYDDYVSEIELAQDRALSATEIFEYSIVNSIPVSGVDSNVKALFRSNYTSVMGTLLIVAVILCGLTLSSEFSSGTVRLLLIRPKTRSKILTSKLLAVLIYILAVSAAAAVIIFVIGLLFVGVGDLFMPDLIYFGGRVFALPSIVMSGVAIFEGIIKVLFFGAVALLISVLAKKAALAIALPIVLQSIGSTVQTVSLLIATVSRPVIPVISILPTTYFELSMFHMTSAEYYASTSGGSLIDILGASTMYYDATARMFPVLGIFYYILFTAGAIALSYLAFNKTQIKN